MEICGSGSHGPCGAPAPIDFLVQNAEACMAPRHSTNPRVMIRSSLAGRRRD